MVIQAARWDEATATSSSNYFAAKQIHQIASSPSNNSHRSAVRCVAVSGRLDGYIAGPLYFIFRVNFRSQTAPSRPVMISHIASAAAVDRKSVV